MPPYAPKKEEDNVHHMIGHAAPITTRRISHLHTMKGTPCLLSALMVAASRTKYLSVRSAEVRSDFVG